MADDTTGQGDGGQGPPPSAWGDETAAAGNPSAPDATYDPPPYRPPGYQAPDEDEPAQGVGYPPAPIAIYPNPGAGATPVYPPPSPAQGYSPPGPPQGYSPAGPPQGYPPPPTAGYPAPGQVQGYGPSGQTQAQGYGPPGRTQAQGYPPAGGYAQGGQFAGWGEPPKPGKALSVLAIVLGVLSLLFVPFGVIAVVLGIIAAAKKQRYGTLALVIALAGLVLGIIIVVLLVG